MSDELSTSVSKPLVVVARTLPSPGRERLAAASELIEGGLEATAADLRGLARGAAAIVADPAVSIDDELLAAAGAELRIVANFAVGYDNVDLDACRARGVVVTNTPDVLTDATAELTLALTLAAARRIGEAERELRAGRWTGIEPGAFLGAELSGASFGVVGMGRIGHRYAELLVPLAGEILYAGRSPSEEAERELGASRLELPQLLRRADVVSLHLPATAETAGLIGAAELEAMRPSAILINTARGSLVDASALADALRSGAIGAAGLDVYEHEPRVPRELLEAPNCVLLPHIGSATVRARERMSALVADGILATLRGAEPPNRVT